MELLVKVMMSRVQQYNAIPELGGIAQSESTNISARPAAPGGRAIDANTTRPPSSTLPSARRVQLFVEPGRGTRRRSWRRDRLGTSSERDRGPVGATGVFSPVARRSIRPAASRTVSRSSGVSSASKARPSQRICRRSMSRRALSPVAVIAMAARRWSASSTPRSMNPASSRLFKARVRDCGWRPSASAARSRSRLPAEQPGQHEQRRRADAAAELGHAAGLAARGPRGGAALRRGRSGFGHRVIVRSA